MDLEIIFDSLCFIKDIKLGREVPIRQKGSAES